MSNSYYPRRLMGPIVLITIGVLFLLDQVFPYRDWGFSHTWPVLLIVIGAVKIFERFFVSPASTYVPPPGSGPGTGPANPAWQGPSSASGPASASGGPQGSPPGVQEPPKS